MADSVASRANEGVQSALIESRIDVTATILVGSTMSPSRRSDRRIEIAIKEHFIDRVVRVCGLRDEGKIKGLIHVPRI
jgi:hypothetical protein